MDGIHEGRYDLRNKHDQFVQVFPFDVLKGEVFLLFLPTIYTNDITKSSGSWMGTLQSFHYKEEEEKKYSIITAIYCTY